MSLASGRWRLFVDQQQVEFLPLWDRPVPQFDDFFADAELAQLDLGDTMPTLRWTHDVWLIDGPVSRGEEASAWMFQGEGEIHLNPYKCLKRSLHRWRRTLLHELSHFVSPQLDRSAISTGHDFTFATTFAACQARIGQPVGLRLYDVSDIPPLERYAAIFYAELVGRRLGEADGSLYEIPLAASKIEMAAQSAGWDQATRPRRKLWFF